MQLYPVRHNCILNLELCILEPFWLLKKKRKFYAVPFLLYMCSSFYVFIISRNIDIHKYKCMNEQLDLLCFESGLVIFLAVFPIAFNTFFFLCIQ